MINKMMPEMIQKNEDEKMILKNDECNDNQND